MKLKKFQIVLIVLIVAAMVTGTVAFAKGKPPKPDDDCKWSDLYCLDVWIPVICNDGVIYSNSCYAMRECATGCVPYGDPIPVLPL